MSKKNIIPIFVPHEGCPENCVFCNQKRITGIETTLSIDAMQKLIREQLRYFANEAPVEVALYGGSFTALKQETQERFLEGIEPFIVSKDVASIRISTRPDAINLSELEFLRIHHVRTIELGIQSLDEEVLSGSRRGYHADIVAPVAALIKRKGFELGLQQMLGLPKDTLKKSVATARSLIAMEPNFVRIYPTLVIKDTPLARAYSRGGYEPLSLEDAVVWLKTIMPLYDKAGIPVIRVGLQVTESINEGKDVLAGPFHPALRELAETELLVERVIATVPTVKYGLSFRGPGRLISLLVGNKGCGRQRLETYYNMKIAFAFADEGHLVADVDGKDVII
ncbi:radical SAM protein [Peptoniphilus equinus]|uniref:Radical SAM protein n=1 Tax=Peptoniphilus equinus TaxID=3016343 RepID=A0ABY7QX00_9FIRM|nr:radical SAM protein [Peptoniphilus equinus]WBW50620.1 radical SAM protein [Peptoniphilus equinus]